MSTPSIPELVLQWQPFASKLARRWACFAPWLDADLLSAAIEGLWHAAVKYVATFDPADTRPFSSLAGVCISRACRQALARERRRHPESFQAQHLDADTPSAAELLTAREPKVGAALEMAELLDGLKERDRAVVMDWLAGCTFREIAEARSLSRSRAGQIFRRGIRRLRERFACAG